MISTHPTHVAWASELCGAALSSTLCRLAWGSSYSVCCVSSLLVLLDCALCRSRLRLLLCCVAVLRRRLGSFSCTGCEPAGLHHLPHPPVVLSPMQHRDQQCTSCVKCVQPLTTNVSAASLCHSQLRYQQLACAVRDHIGDEGRYLSSLYNRAASELAGELGFGSDRRDCETCPSLRLRHRIKACHIMQSCLLKSSCSS